MKILIAGFQHETNTFAPTKAGWQSFIQAVEAAGHTLVPVIWAGASASAHVTEDAYERIAGEIVDAVRRGGFDAIYLDLHGAMVAEHVDDGEGELLARVRGVVGKAMPLVVSLDL